MAQREKPDIGWGDVAGLEAAKKKARETIVEPLNGPAGSLPGKKISEGNTLFYGNADEGRLRKRDYYWPQVDNEALIKAAIKYKHLVKDSDKLSRCKGWKLVEDEVNLVSRYSRSSSQCEQQVTELVSESSYRRIERSPGFFRHYLSEKAMRLEELVQQYDEATDSDQQTARVTRRPKWKEGELQAMLQAAFKYRHIVMHPKLDHRYRGWQRVAEKVNKVSPHSRSVADCKRKMIRFVSECRTKRTNRNSYVNMNGHGAIPPDSELTRLQKLALEIADWSAYFDIARPVTSPVADNVAKPVTQPITQQVSKGVEQRQSTTDTRTSVTTTTPRHTATATTATRTSGVPVPEKRKSPSDESGRDKVARWLTEIKRILEAETEANHSDPEHSDKPENSLPSLTKPVASALSTADSLPSLTNCGDQRTQTDVQVDNNNKTTELMNVHTRFLDKIASLMESITDKLDGLAPAINSSTTGTQTDASTKLYPAATQTCLDTTERENKTDDQHRPVCTAGSQTCDAETKQEQKDTSCPGTRTGKGCVKKKPNRPVRKSGQRRRPKKY